MKVFLTGATGILGTAILGELEDNNCEVIGFSSKDIKLANYSEVIKKVTDFNPDVVIHSAAMTNVDRCEENKSEALSTNVIGSKNVSTAALRVGAKIVYISSCGVYGNGKSEPYTELDLPNPVNYHHYTKLEGERCVKEHNPNFLVIRPGWLFGGSTLHAKNFVEARRREILSSSNIIKSAVDKSGSPTYTLDLARQILSLLNNDIIGTFNVVNEGCASRFDYVYEIVKLFGFDIKVEPVSSDQFLRRASMPDNECLANMFLNLHQLNLMRPWREALKSYISANYYI
jgi:dTDP-4-dehydrorhamnose reductase